KAKNSDDEGNDEENIGLNVGREEGQDEEDDEDELYRDVNINLEGRVSSSLSSQFVTSMLNPTPDAGIDLIFETTSQMDVQAPTKVAPLPLSAPNLTPSTIATISTVPQAPTPSTTASSTLLQNLPNFGSLFGFEHRLKTLEANFSEFMQTNRFAGFDRLCDEAQAENEEFLKNLDENIQKIIKDQVKEQVKTSYAVAVDLSEMELKKILIEKMEGNKYIHRSDEQRNLYKALVEAYESDKIILDTYEDVVMLKRCRDDDADKDEEPSAGSDRGSKRRREGKEPDEFATTEEPMQNTHDLEEPLHPEFKTGAADDQPIAETSQHPEWFSQQKKPPTPDRDWNKTLPATYGSIQPWIKEVYKATTVQLDWINPEGQQYPHNLLKPLPLITNSRGRRVILFDHFINNDLEYVRGGASSRKYTTSVTKIKAADYGHIKWIEDLVPRTMWIQEPVGYDKHALWGISHWGRKRQQFYGFAVNRKSARDVYSNRRIITVTELKIVEWHNYKHLDWIMVHEDDDKLYNKEGDFKRLRIQDIEDMLLLLVQGKLKNLTVEEHFAFNVSLRMFTKSILIQRHVEDLQLDVESYQKKLNLTRPDIDGTLTDVCTALDDRLKGIQMKYLPQTIWRKSNKERAAAMIHAIDKQLKTRRIIKSLERFVGRRLNGGDFRMLQQTI
nr:hypothetical protein [Tanacetum cinerariifolium]